MNKKIVGILGGSFLISLVAGLALFAVSNVLSTGNSKVLAKKTEQPSACTTIQSGTLLASDGSIITPGYDKWGYNYQARMFNGKYCDAYRDAAWCQLYKNDDLMMKWNDAWISNQDCDGDGKLDRHYGYPSYIGSGAWLTNHQSGSYPCGEGEECHWTYFVKIVAVPSDAVKTDGVWYTIEGDEIGPDIWGEFAVVEEIYNDPKGGFNGVQYLSPIGPGFGKFK